MNIKRIVGIITVIALFICVMSLTVSAQGIAVDDLNFPDKNFRDYVSKNFDIDNNDILSEEEILQIKYITVNGNGVKDLTGIEYFTSLQILNCRDNDLPFIDVSNVPSLEALDCAASEVNSLDISGNENLRELYCNNNNIKTLDVTKNTQLEKLDVSLCPISSLDLSNNTKLNSLKADSCGLRELDLTKINDLEYLNVDNNHLTYLDLEPFAQMGYATPGNQTRDVIITDDIISLSLLGDSSKISDVTGGALNGDELVVNAGATVTYKYYTGNSNDYLNVTLNVSVVPHNASDKFEYDENSHWCDCQYYDCFVKHEETPHNYSVENVDTAYWASNATCEESAKFYKSCICGAHGEETFDYGTPNRHVDRDGDGTCDGCTVIPDNSNPAMIFDISIIFEFIMKLFSFIGNVF